jgi:hypothetical protein
MPANKKSSKSIIADETIIRKIYVTREQKVMPDFDLAALYEVETKVFNQAVKRNGERFLRILCFVLAQKNGKL